MTRTNTILGIICVALILTLLFSIDRCGRYRDHTTDLQGQLDYSKQSIDSFRNARGKVVVEQKVITVTDGTLIKKLSDEKFQLQKKYDRYIKDVKTYIEVRQEYRIDTLFAPYLPDSLQVDTLWKVRNGEYVITPQRFEHKDSLTSIEGTVKAEGVIIGSLSIVDTFSLRVVDIKRHLFGSTDLTIQSIHSNPNVKTTSMNSISVKEKHFSIWKIVGVVAIFIAGVIAGK